MSNDTLTVDIENLEATQRFGRCLGAVLEPGHVIALIGPLGSGKTTLVKSIAAGAGVDDARRVTSPTFVIVNEYEAPRSAGPLRLYHVDAYRLRGSGDLLDLGFDEICSLGAVLVEWADRVADALPLERLTLLIEPVDDHRRRFHCTAVGRLATTFRSVVNAASGLSDGREPGTIPPA